MAKHLHPRVAGLQECDYVSEMARNVARHRQEQRADRLLLDMVDAAMNEAEWTRHRHRKIRQQRAARGFSRDVDPEDEFGALTRNKPAGNLRRQLRADAAK
jgi:hypothetical protein